MGKNPLPEEKVMEPLVPSRKEVISAVSFYTVAMLKTRLHRKYKEAQTAINNRRISEEKRRLSEEKKLPLNDNMELIAVKKRLSEEKL